MANGSSFEALLRYDHFMPNTATTLGARRDVAGSRRHAAERAAAEPDDLPASRTGSRTRATSRTAILLDYDGQQFDNITTAPVQAVALHGLINF